MDERIELNVFLSKLVAAIVQKFESMDAKMRDMRMQIDSLKQGSNQNAIKSLEDKVRNLEMTVNSLKSKSQIDTSILKLIETEEGQRKA